MLVLTRKKDEAIVIDDRITIRVLRTQGNHVRLGVEAPSDVRIRRSEIAPRREAHDGNDAVGRDRPACSPASC